MGVERSRASVWDDVERRCELSFQMGNGEFPISAKYPGTGVQPDFIITLLIILIILIIIIESSRVTAHVTAVLTINRHVQCKGTAVWTKNISVPTVHGTITYSTYVYFKY